MHVTPTKTMPTRLGLHLSTLGCLAMIGGAVQGFNLLLVLSSTLLATIIMHWRWSSRSVEAVDSQRRLPKEVFAGKPFQVRYQTNNRNRWMPAWLIQIQDRIVDSHNPAIRVFANGGVGTLPAGATSSVALDVTIDRRGEYEFGPVQISTTFPFALVQSKRVEPQIQTLSVYPALVPLPNHWKRQLVSRHGGAATAINRAGSNEGEFFAMREYQYGDNPKWINWRASARVGQPMVRQFEQQQRYELCLVLDAFQADASENAVNICEYAISYLTSMLVDLVQLPSNRIVLATAGSKVRTMQTSNDPQTVRQMLDGLAALVPSSLPPVGEAIATAAKLINGNRDVVVISTRSMDDAFAADSSVAMASATWQRRGRFKWITVGPPKSDDLISPSNDGMSTSDSARRPSGKTSAQADSGLNLNGKATFNDDTRTTNEHPRSADSTLSSDTATVQ